MPSVLVQNRPARRDRNEAVWRILTMIRKFQRCISYFIQPYTTDRKGETGAVRMTACQVDCASPQSTAQTIIVGRSWPTAFFGHVKHSNRPLQGKLDSMRCNANASSVNVGVNPLWRYGRMESHAGTAVYVALLSGPCVPTSSLFTTCHPSQQQHKYAGATIKHYGAALFIKLNQQTTFKNNSAVERHNNSSVTGKARTTTLYYIQTTTTFFKQG